MLALVRRLARARRAWPTLAQDDPDAEVHADGRVLVLAYPGLACAYNLSARPATVPGLRGRRVLGERSRALRDGLALDGHGFAWLARR